MPTLCCRYAQYPLIDTPEGEWVPMGLRETVCVLRKSDPPKYRQLLRQQGIEIEEGDLECRHNLDASWADCPLSVIRSR